MKKMMKKTFSLLLIFMLAFTMIPTSTLKVSAKAAAATTQAKKATTKTAKKKKKTKAKKQRTVFIAAGHQQRGISSTERLAPGSSRRKAKLTSGTAGVRTHIPEYKTNLAIAKATKKELTEFFDPPKSKKTQEKAKKSNVIKIKFEELENYIPNDIYHPEENNSDDIKFFIFEALEFYIVNRRNDTNE